MLHRVSMSSEVQPRPDDSPNTSGGSSDAEQREAAPPEQPGPEQRDQSQPKKKEAKISSKTAAKLSTSAKRPRVTDEEPTVINRNSNSPGIPLKMTACLHTWDDWRLSRFCSRELQEYVPQWSSPH
ncbi:hypothetical protein XENORESO_007177 [Xenotaenia resolanae]|uniref:Uncharacterized protein n=1 Tax=Xenotaenia resolanae TaxID=208358 RepID=A0ABV0W334_9TELE